jgi:hypothetical protein
MADLMLTVQQYVEAMSVPLSRFAQALFRILVNV